MTDVRILIVGLGGLGCPAAWALAQSRNVQLVLVDDDVVDEANLGRQILFSDGDVGRAKLLAARDALHALGLPDDRVELHQTRLLPENARALIQGADVVVEGADNYATKFLTCDACHLEGVAVVQGAALGWRATVLSSSPSGRPCYRCLFEDVPGGALTNCETGGIMGPVAGLAGALMAEQALRIAAGRRPYGQVLSYDGKRDILRSTEIHARDNCPLCGSSPTILSVEEARYLRQTCAA